MDCDSLINSRLKQLNELKLNLNHIDERLLSVAQELNWDYKKLLEEGPSNMVTCSINNQHRVPELKLSSHEEKCRWRQQGYRDDDKFFPDHSGSGSYVTLTSELLKSITANISQSSEPEPPLRSVPQTSANFDQNFSREEKLAIYDYVVANTEQQKSFSDLCFQLSEKKEENERKEMAPWEIAAAERDAKRRRMSYRNKVHNNRKTQTEILREVIEIQMELLKEEVLDSELTTGDKDSRRREKDESNKKRKRRDSDEELKYSNRDTSSRRRDKDDHHKSRKHDRHSKHGRDRTRRKRSPSFAGSDSNSRSRSHDRFRKWKPYDGRSHSHKSKEYPRRKE